MTTTAVMSALLTCALLVVGCATTPRPASIMVVDKDVRHQWDSDVIGYRTHPITGRVQEIRREEIYRDFWVKGADGEWYRVPRQDWEAAQIGQTLWLRPGERERVTRPISGPCIGPDARWRC